MEKTKYFANFDGDDLNGHVYKLGEEIKDDVDGGTLNYLLQTGRISSTKPDTEAVMSAPAVDDKPLALMDRAELERTALATIDLSGYSDEQLRERIEAHRAGDEAEDDEDEGATGGAPTPPAPPQGETGQSTATSTETDDAALSPLLSGSVDDLKGHLADMTDVAKVERLRELEAAGSNRTTAVAAIDARIAALKSAD